jgi:hypothetical protein
MSASAKLILGCPEIYREPMRRKLGLELVEGRGPDGKPSGKRHNPLAYIRPQETAIASISNRGENRPMVGITL